MNLNAEKRRNIFFVCKKRVPQQMLKLHIADEKLYYVYLHMDIHI